MEKEQKKYKKALPYMNADEMERNKDDIKNVYMHHETRVLQSEKFRSILRKHIKNSDKLLDLGSANGYAFQVLHGMGIDNTYGADYGNYLTVDRPHHDFKTFDFNTARFPYADGEFDSITNVETLEHLENPFHFFRETSRILKPGGILILTTPNPSHVFNKILFALREKFYRFLDGNDHITLFTYQILSKGALKYFDLVEREYLMGEMPWRFLHKFAFPENKHFGRSGVFVLRKKR